MLAILAMIAAAPMAATALPVPIVIGHRGASGERPEHTIASYSRAIDQGTDFVEPDLVMTKDRVLVARHENEISGTTDVAAHPEFAARKATRMIDGQAVTGWFTEDFTLAELRTLRARERLPALRGTAFDGQFVIPTFADVLDLIARHNKTGGHRVGVYPEIKHGTYFASIGLSMEAPLLAMLKTYGYAKATDRVFIQSFEVGNLQRLHRTTRIRLVQLMDAEGGPADRANLTYAAMATPAGLKAIAAYANAVGVAKAVIVPRDAAGRSLTPTGFVTDAHRAGLKVHVWTFRAENAFLPSERRATGGAEIHGDLAAEVRQFLALGVDGVFSDFPGQAVVARDKIAMVE